MAQETNRGLDIRASCLEEKKELIASESLAAVANGEVTRTTDGLVIVRATFGQFYDSPGSETLNYWAFDNQKAAGCFRAANASGAIKKSGYYTCRADFSFQRGLCSFWVADLKYEVMRHGSSGFGVRIISEEVLHTVFSDGRVWDKGKDVD